jgi:diguanylate cyclase (GGDEF)-like protein
VAVWGALILSAGISRRLNQQHSVLMHQAMHDALTSLPNRNLLQERVNRVVRTRARDQGISALFMMDLDRFKEVNDTLGHDSGDQLLMQVGERVRGVLRDTDTVARLGGDEFAVLLPVTSHEQAVQVATRIQQAMSEPFCICNVLLDINISIGIALFPMHGDDAETLIKRADIAMYQAKREGRGWVVYDTETDPHSLRRLTLTTDLRCAIDDGALSLCYQPKASLTSAAVLGVEALCRWHSERFGQIAPDEFIGLAENSGLIKPLTNWVMRASLAQCALWRKQGIDLSVAVNLSARNLHDPDLPEQVERLLSEAGVPSSSLELEITESAVMADPAYALRILTRLHNMGVRLAIDDFGTGHSSLAYLKRLPVDEIKIDKSFILELPEDGDNAVIVRAIIELAHNMGREVVAEGIENQSVWQWLELNGCDIAQGYFLGRPMPVRDLEAWLLARSAVAGLAPRELPPIRPATLGR